MEYLNSDQVEQLKKIGAYLQDKRQDMSITIEDVASKTLIRASMLKALEEGQINVLPEPIFVQGFIRRYGDVLKLDGAALAKNFSTNILPTQSNISAQSSPTIPSKVISIYVLYSLLLVTAVGGLFYLLDRPQKAENVLQSKKSLATQQKKKVAIAVPSASATPKASESSFPIQITVNANDKCWLRVIVDGKTQFEDPLKKGDKKTWTAKKQLKLQIGDAGAVAISFNGGEPKILGKVGDVKEVTFTPNH